MQQLGTKSYPAYSPDVMRNATLTALKVQGYTVVVETPRIRTAPRLVAVTAVRGYGSAQAFGESVAWDIDVQPSGTGSVVHASPRASVNGMPMEQVYYEWAENAYGSLFKEIDGSLPARADVVATPSPAVAPYR